MKKLLLLRHGEAETSTGSDFNRNLTFKGKSKLMALGQRLSNRSAKIELMYCSPSTRTVETYELIKKYISINETIFEKAIYSSSLEILLNMLEKTPKKVQTCLLVGHNPTLSLLATYLSSGDYLSLQPGMMVIMELEIDDWKLISMGTASVREVLS